MQTATRVARLATGYGERCLSPPHTVDCSLVDGALRAQRERCVKDERDCRVPHKLVTTYDYSRQGVWRVREREERLAAAGRKAARIARAGARGGARAAAGEAAAVAGVVGATGRDPVGSRKMSKTVAMVSYAELKSSGVPVRVLKEADISPDCEEVSIVEVCVSILAGCFK